LSLLFNKTGRQLSEAEQNVIRLMIGCGVLVSLLWVNPTSVTVSSTNPALVTISSYLLFTTLLAIGIWQKLGSSSTRRSIAIFTDIFAATLLLIFGGEYTAPVCITYYLLILSYGINSHKHEFRISTSLSVVGFSCAIYFNDFWQSQPILSMGLLFGMVVMAMLISKHMQRDVTTAINTEQPPHDTKHDEGIKVLLVTQDSIDRHMVLSHLNSWKIPVTICNSSVRAFAKLIHAVENGAGYTTVIVDSLNLDMDPGQFSKSLRFENKLGDINLIHLSPGLSKEQEEQLLATGYSKLITIPLDKTILFDAIHSSTAELHGNSNVTRLISRYLGKKDSPHPADILLAIGNPIEQTLFRSILEKDGQRVYSVSTGSQALDALNTHQFDMVIIDLKMPDIDGKDLIRLYYYTYLNQEWVPFIALVDEATPSVLYQCREAEVDAIMVRPVSEQKLLMTVADIAASKTKQIEPVCNFPKPNHASDSINAENSDPTLNTHTLRQLENLSSSNVFLERMISNFHNDMNKTLDGLQRAIDNHHFKEFQDFAHALRDTSSNLGAISLHRLSLKALQINQSEFQQRSKTLLNELHLALEKTMRALREYVTKSGNSATEQE
jgi:CheY-like chemotaxis protein